MEEGLEACEAALGVSSSPTSSSGDPTFSSNSSASNFSALLDALDLEPVGGVRATGGYVAIENVRRGRIGPLLPFSSFGF